MVHGWSLEVDVQSEKSLAAGTVSMEQHWHSAVHSHNYLNVTSFVAPGVPSAESRRHGRSEPDPPAGRAARAAVILSVRVTAIVTVAAHQPKSGHWYYCPGPVCRSELLACHFRLNTLLRDVLSKWDSSEILPDSSESRTVVVIKLRRTSALLT